METLHIKIRSGVPTKDARVFAKILAGMYFLSPFGRTAMKITEDEYVVLCSPFNFENHYGIHRLVRVSPFDKQKRRHTCFATIEIDKKYRDDNVASYIFDPYQVAKNHLTNTETQDLFGVLQGNLLSI